MKKFLFGLGCLGMVGLLAACGRGQAENKLEKEEPDQKIALILGFGGVDDRSFNQAGWEGLEKWGEEKDLKAKKDFTYLETNDPQENSTNISQAVENGFTTIISLSYLQADAIKEAAEQNPKLNFALIDGEISNEKNIVSATFKDQESAYLAGLAAAYSTKKNHVGFIGGMEGPVIQRFQSGFEEGVKAGAKNLGKKISIDAQYAASYDAPDKGKAIAASMYKEGADIIYQAAGSTGAGVFQEAKARNENDKTQKVWVIGVDRDQTDEGDYHMTEDKIGNFTLTSTKKNVGAAVRKIAAASYEKDFPGGEHLEFGLKEGGVNLTKGQLSKEAYEAVTTAKKQIIDGKIKVPEN
ncbi:BMP family ABC transporter substrate-binding protein [Enterococcus avium]|uniref:BMP family lipoprotein n=1 Tax=Enterococcus avium TaxID=33945 RepID=UPI00232C655B|nr:BMP family ABC transporter substrate-binding protein [Enterococcus avium]MDB1748292.1 BMP family ABC transporter substrate-binding protein [Enterococcus avium]MDB1752495.1 BMP family ABC transporter substrate-binding protein [Enterococcus avium]MDB1759544.1 BMP family ABC transporter substrate-binding protein [Enterococcus avium]